MLYGQGCPVGFHLPPIGFNLATPPGASCLSGPMTCALPDLALALCAASNRIILPKPRPHLLNVLTHLEHGTAPKAVVGSGRLELQSDFRQSRESVFSVRLFSSA